MIKLTCYVGFYTENPLGYETEERPIYIQPSGIVVVIKGDKTTTIQIGCSTKYEVKETPEQIFKAIEDLRQENIAKRKGV